MIINTILASIIVILLVTMTVHALFSRKTEQQEPDPCQVLCDSIENHFEQWRIVDRSCETNDYKIWWQVNHMETKVAISVKWWGSTSYYEDYVGFFKDSSVQLRLSKAQMADIYHACERALAKKLQRKMTPKEVDYRDGYFYCPYCGEKVDARVVKEEEDDLGRKETRGVQETS